MKQLNRNLNASAPPRTCVIGVGDGGCRAVERIAAQWAGGPAAVAVNTNARSLDELSVPAKVAIGAKTTQGLGAGGDPSLGRLSAEEDSRVLSELFAEVDLAFVVVGLGGGTGTGAAPVVARVAREKGALVMCFATLPFNFEGETRRTQALRGLASLREDADAVIAVPNQRLFELVRSGATAEDAFDRADEARGEGIRAIWNVLQPRGLISLDFAGLRSVVQHSGGTSVFGCGEAEGADRARAAAAAALDNPLLDHGRAVGHARSLLVSVVGGASMTLGEIEAVMNAVSAAAPNDARVFMGAATRPEWGDRLSVTIVASEQWNVPAEDSGAAGAGAGVEEVETGEGGGRRKRAGKATQTKLSLEATGRGRFKDVEPTILDGEDLDIPTFRRRGIVVDKL